MRTMASDDRETDAYSSATEYSCANVRSLPVSITLTLRSDPAEKTPVRETRLCASRGSASRGHRDGKTRASCLRSPAVYCLTHGGVRSRISAYGSWLPESAFVQLTIHRNERDDDIGSARRL